MCLTSVGKVRDLTATPVLQRKKLRDAASHNLANKVLLARKSITIAMDNLVSEFKP